MSDSTDHIIALVAAHVRHYGRVPDPTAISEMAKAAEMARRMLLPACKLEDSQLADPAVNLAENMHSPRRQRGPSNM